MSNYLVIGEFIQSKMYKLRKNEKGQSFTELIILICVGVIVAAFVILPQLRDFSERVMGDLSYWWINTISDTIFPTS